MIRPPEVSVEPNIIFSHLGFVTECGKVSLWYEILFCFHFSFLNILFTWQLIWTECLVRKVKCLGFEEESFSGVHRWDCVLTQLPAPWQSSTLIPTFEMKSSAFILWSALKKKCLSPVSFVKSLLKNERPLPPGFSQGHMSSCRLAGCLEEEEGEEGEELDLFIRYITSPWTNRLLCVTRLSIVFPKLHLLVNLILSGLFQGFYLQQINVVCLLFVDNNK